jgi:zinc protease
MKIVAMLAALTLTTPLLIADPAKVDGFTYMRSAGGIDEYRLDANGLRILLRPVKAAPVVTFMVTYHVGSRNEVTGTTGATHLLEHLMFKGTEKFDRSKGTGFDQLLERVGAETNATTWLDRTNYFATVPSNAFPLLVEVEADRMRNLALREEDRRPEMTVVRNEFERGENNPASALEKEIWSSAFMAHPYHHDTIGWRSDIEKVPNAKLRAFYDTFYWPNNATATVIGDFQPAEALATLKQFYGPIPKSPHPFPEVYTEEPEQSGQRRVRIQRAGELGVVTLAHKIPPGTHEDWPAVEVLSTILTSGKTSRCYRALTDKNLTLDVSGTPSFNRDPSLHSLTAELAVGVKHDVVEKALVAEIEKIKKEGVTAAEVQIAVAKLLADSTYARDGSFNSAAVLNECIAVGDWTLFITQEEKLKAVTPEIVQMMAKRYFVERRSVAGWFVPNEGPADAEAFEATEQPVEEKFKQKEVLPPKPPEKELAAPARTNFATTVVREKVAGIDVLVAHTDVKNVVTIHGSLSAGEAASPNRALAHLTAGMLERGTTKHDQFAIADQLEHVGASIDFTVGTETVEFTARCLTPNVPLVLELLAEQLRLPAFSEEEFGKLKTQVISATQQSLEDTDIQAAVAFSQAAFPVGHPNRKASVPELIAAIEKATLAEVRDFHAAVYGPATLHLAAAGDIDPAVVKTAIAKEFAGWNGGKAIPATPAIAASAGEKTVNIPEKTSVSVIIGQPTSVQASDPDWLALDLANTILGRSFTSRLMGTVRDREGLTYGIGSRLAGDTFRPGSFYVRATFAPALLEKGLASTRRELLKWCKEGVTADEVNYRQSSLIGQFSVSLETTQGLAEALLRCAERGFDVKWLDEYPAKLRALTLEQVNAAIKKHLDPEKMVTVKAGTL